MLIEQLNNVLKEQTVQELTVQDLILFEVFGEQTELDERDVNFFKNFVKNVKQSFTSQSDTEIKEPDLRQPDFKGIYRPRKIKPSRTTIQDVPSPGFNQRYKIKPVDISKLPDNWRGLFRKALTKEGFRLKDKTSIAFSKSPTWMKYFRLSFSLSNRWKISPSSFGQAFPEDKASLVISELRRIQSSVKKIESAIGIG